MNSDFSRGFKAGIPIALGYFPVSFTFGLIAVNGGIPVWLTIFISFSNLTSAGQFAGTNLIIANVPFIEIALTTFVINIRYMLMSLSLSQKIKANMPMLHRCIIAFGITDETFAVASLEKKLTFLYDRAYSRTFCRLGSGNCYRSNGLFSTSEQVQSAMGIALYAMFIALVIPPSKNQKRL